VSPSAIIALEFALVLVVVLGFGIWQLVSVRREIARDREKEAPPPADPPAAADEAPSDRAGG
jgi:hypothetical protein